MQDKFTKEWHRGDKITHPLYGDGVIEDIIDKDDYTLVVSFSFGTIHLTSPKK